MQELRARALRVARSGGDSNAILAEKALPKLHPNVLLLLAYEAVEAITEAEWGEKRGLAGRKAHVLAWTVGSALAPAPLPGVAQAEAKRLVQHVREVRGDIERAGNDNAKIDLVRERAYVLFPTREPEPVPQVEGHSSGSNGGRGGDGGGDGGGDERRFSDDDSDDEPRPWLPPSLGVSRATQLACDINEDQARELGPAGVSFINQYFAQPVSDRGAEPWCCTSSFLTRAYLWLAQAAEEAEGARELRATVEARTREVEQLRLQLRDADTRNATLEGVLGKLQGRLMPETSGKKRARG